MTASIQREFSFHAGTHINGFQIGCFEFTLFMEIETDSPHEQNVAMDRVKMFTYDCLNDAIFVNSKDKKTIDKYLACGLKVCTLPEDPHDQMIMVMLYKKLTAIVEGRLVLLEISLTSSNGDGISYIHAIDEHAGPYELSGWWDKSDISISEEKKSKDKVVNLFARAPSWDEIGLGWKERELSLIPDIPFQTV